MSFLKQIQTSREHFVDQAAASDNLDIQKIAAQVKAGQRNLADFALYSIVDARNKSLVRFFESQDKEEIGIKNIATARLEKGEVFMCTAIQLLAGSDGGAAIDPFGTDVMSGIAFASVGAVGALANGEWRLEVNSQIIVPRSSVHSFVTDGWNVPVGLFPLTNPKIIEDNVPILFEVETKNAIPDRYALKAIMYGTVTVPA